MAYPRRVHKTDPSERGVFTMIAATSLYNRLDEVSISEPIKMSLKVG